MNISPILYNYERIRTTHISNSGIETQIEDSSIVITPTPKVVGNEVPFISTQDFLRLRNSFARNYSLIQANKRYEDSKQEIIPPSFHYVA